MADLRMPDACLVVVGHGAASEPASRDSTENLARDIARRGLFAQVRAAFLRIPPLLPDVLDELKGHKIFVVPHLAGEGVVGDEALAKALRGSVGDIVVCKASGTHADVPALAARRIRELCATAAIDPARIGILAAGHGTFRNPDSGLRVRALAEALRSVSATAAAFIEERPLIGEWDRLLPQSDIVVVPLLMAEGRHGGSDVARMLGIGEGDSGWGVFRAGKPFAGPFGLKGRRVWLLRPLGTDPAFADIVLARVVEAAG
jgi:sirohydrochlorin ferrochelatase